MKYDLTQMRGRDVYRLLISLIVPRPIAWVGTRSADGVDNLAPFSYFMGVSSKPPLVAVSIARAGRDAVKDTLQNILDTEVLTISIASTDLLTPMHRTASRLPPEVSEFEHAGLEPVDGDVVAAPRPAAARVAMECRLHQAIDLGTTHLVLAEVLCVHADDAVLGPDGRVDEFALAPIARLGPAGYAGLGARLTPEPEEAG